MTVVEVRAGDRSANVTLDENGAVRVGDLQDAHPLLADLRRELGQERRQAVGIDRPVARQIELHPAGPRDARGDDVHPHRGRRELDPLEPRLQRAEQIARVREGHRHADVEAQRRAAPVVFQERCGAVVLARSPSVQTRAMPH